MNIIFDHRAGLGKITQMDFIYAPCAAYPLPSEELQAVESGWAKNEWSSDGDWYQARQVRVATYAKPKMRRPAFLSFSLSTGIEAIDRFDEYEAVCDAYRAHHKFSAHLNLRQTIETDVEQKRALTCSIGSRIAAFTIMRLGRGYISSLQFCWDYADRGLRLGYIMQDEECLRAAAMGFRHLYIGPGYELACAYKARLDGFQWWTGGGWSDDGDEYQRLCLRDTEASRFEEIAF